jgi:type II secretory ATPase GspE/PulE/Tfp pilus assembly ATPase PilB-like protein
MLDKLIKKKDNINNTEIKKKRKFDLGFILKERKNTENVETKEGKIFNLKKEFNFSFKFKLKLKGKDSKEVKQTNTTTNHLSHSISSELYERPRKVIAKLFGENQVDSIMDEIIKSGKDRYTYLTMEKGIKEEILIEVYHEVYNNNFTLSLEGEDFFVDKDGYLIDRKTGFKYHYLPIDKDVILVPRSVYLQKLNTSKVEEGMTEEGDLWKIFVDTVKKAMGRKVNDILIEGQGSVYKIFYKQLGGGKLPIMTLTSKEGIQMVQMLKNRASEYSEVKANVNDRPQSGRIVLDELGAELRLEFQPSVEGESIAVRIFNISGYFNKRLEELGYEKEFIEEVRRIAVRKNGLILVSGSTGQGKSTLIKSMLLEANPEVKRIILLEDPVEMKVKGTIQMNVGKFSFADGVRSCMRAVPDIIVVGETRDGETAKNTIDAAMSGHLTYTTIHANDCIGAIERFVLKAVETGDISAEDVRFNISSTLLLSVNQILVRLIDGRIKPIVEYLIPDHEERILIREGRFEELRERMKEKGMILNRQIERLYESGLITEDQYLSYLGVK